jgi:hypothetical protein
MEILEDKLQKRLVKLRQKRESFLQPKQNLESFQQENGYQDYHARPLICTNASKALLD